MNVVKNECPGAWQTAFVKLRERLETALQYGIDTGRLNPKNAQHDWALKAGRSKNYVTGRMSTLSKKPNGVLMPKEGAALAKVLGISSTWLISGEGAMLASSELKGNREAARDFWLAKEETREDLSRAMQFLAEDDKKAFSKMQDATADAWLLHYVDGFRMWKRAQKTGDSPFGAGTRVADEE